MKLAGSSKSQVSKLCKEIDERVHAFLDRPLAGEWPYLWLDATYLEAGLLLQAVQSGRSGCFFLQREMHALVAAVLLRVARLDALDGDAEAEAPHREFGEIEEAVRTGERHAIVRPDRLG